MSTNKNDDQMTPDKTTSKGGNEEIVGLPPDIQDDIGRRLRGLYGQLAAEPLPDRFMKLLNELSAAEEPGNKHSE